MNQYLNKQLKIRDKNLKYDFLPSMIEIIERPANKLGNSILLLIVALIITTIIWAAMFKIDIAVTAIGSAMPEGGVITLASAYGGRVSEIYAEDKEFVKEGDIILSLENTEAKISVLECEYNLELLKVQREMYGRIYEILYTEDVADEEVDKEEDIQIDTSLYGEYSSVADAIALEHEVYKEGLSLLEDNDERESARKEHMLAVLQNINTLDVKIYSSNMSLQNAESKLEQYIVRAPANGQITQMSLFTKGTLVAAGEAVGYLLHEDTKSIFNAYVSDEDIGQIREGDSVSVRIAAYDDTEYKYMEGNVRAVGDIALNIEAIGAVYLVEIQIDDLPQDVKAGMEGSCDIIVGKRSVLDYFLEPFIEGLDNSLKER